MDANCLKVNPEETPWVSVSLERTRQCRFHAGILFRDADGKLSKLHFGWHRHLHIGPIRDTLVCVVPGLKFDEDQMWLSVFCARVARNPRKNIPYNLRCDENVTFDRETGEIRLSGATGLSCATFVVAVFRSAGHPIVDASNWPDPSPEDLAIQAEFVEILLNSDDADENEQGAIIRGEIGVPRIRPDHVAGACLEPHHQRPVQHETCETNAAFVVQQLQAQIAAVASASPNAIV